MVGYHITLGAATTAGGKVVSAISNRSINGVKVACAGDTVACPACKSEGVIEPDGPRLSERFKGRQVDGWKLKWDLGHQLKFGVPFKEIKTGFAQITDGDPAGSVKQLAKHEQVNVLQAIMYNDPAMQRALANNQLAWAIGFPSGVYMEIQLTLSAQCKPKDG